MLAPASKDLVSGLAFGSYAVRELIGRGGMASVYRAEHLLLNKPVALKVMDRSLLSHSGAAQRFLREGRAVAAIKHPNVVDIADVGVHEGVPYLVMELLTGEDLARFLTKHGPLDDELATRLALPIISALDAAHANGVIHRDIKPSNIFLARGPDDQIVPKVLDFGISKLSFESTRLDVATTPNDQIIGTPLYLPPEALRGAHDLGPAADQYSLGVVLYQCVTGRTPFAGDTLIALLNALSRGSFEPPRAIQPNVSVALERVILRALEADPKDRFPSLREMGRALLAIAGERTRLLWAQSFEPPSSRKPGEIVSLEPKVPSASTGPVIASSTIRSTRRRRVRVAAGALIATLVVGGVGWSQWASSSNESGGTKVSPPAVSTSAASLSPAAWSSKDRGDAPAVRAEVLPAAPITAPRVEPVRDERVSEPPPPVAAAAANGRTDPHAQALDPSTTAKARAQRRPLRQRTAAPQARPETARSSGRTGDGSTGGVVSAAPAPASAPPPRSRRRGANHSPLFD